MKKIIKIFKQKLMPLSGNDLYSWTQIENALTESDSDLMPVIIDGITHLVKPVITLAQIKRIAGADNAAYRVACLNKPESWQNKQIAENDFIDLKNPDYPVLEFNCVYKYE